MPAALRRAGPLSHQGAPAGGGTQRQNQQCLDDGAMEPKPLRPILKSLINSDQPPFCDGRWYYAQSYFESGGFLELATCLGLLCLTGLFVALS